MEAVIYARVSSREQEETGYSLQAQRELLDQYADRNAFKVVRMFIVAESATQQQGRKVFDEMLEFTVANNIVHIICEKTDRLTRSPKDAVVIDEWVQSAKERRVHFVKESFVLSEETKAHENFVWNMKVAVSKLYTDNLSEEVKKGQKAKVASGWLPTKPPLGYKTTGEAGKKIHIKDEEVAPLVADMFQQYATGLYSLQKLVEAMYEKGLRTRTGSKLVKSRLADLLKDPFYYGDFRWNQVVYKGKHEPLIDKALFDKVQSVLSAKNTPKYSKHSYLFKSLITCRECGGVVTWEKQKGITYGHCNHYRQCTKRPWYKEEDLTKQVEEILQPLKHINTKLGSWIEHALKAEYEDTATQRDTEAANIQSQITRIQHRLDQMYDDRLDGRITTEMYDQKSSSLISERDDLERQTKNLNQTIDKKRSKAIEFYELSQNAIMLFSAASIEKKRQLLNLIVSELYINDGVLEFEYTKPFKLIVEAVVATNSSKQAQSIESPIQIFELFKDGSNKGKDAQKCASRPVWLRR